MIKIYKQWRKTGGNSKDALKQFENVISKLDSQPAARRLVEIPQTILHDFRFVKATVLATGRDYLSFWAFVSLQSKDYAGNSNDADFQREALTQASQKLFAFFVCLLAWGWQSCPRSQFGAQGPAYVFLQYLCACVCA